MISTFALASDRTNPAAWRTSGHIFLVEVDDRLARLEVELWILLDRSIEGLRGLSTQVDSRPSACALQCHAPAVSRSDEFFGRQVSRRVLLYQERVALRAIRKSPNAWFRATFRRVLVTHKLRKLHIRRKNRITDNS